MTAVSEDLQNLGRCEARIEELDRQRRQLPQAIERELAAAGQARAAIDRARETQAQAEKQRREREAELGDLEARRQKLQGQSAQVKTNQEYTTLLREIDDAGVGISRLEDAILESMDSIERIKREVAESEREQGEIERGHQKLADQLRAELSDVEKQLESLQGERGELASRLPDSLSRVYQLRLSNAGSGTTPLSGRSCGRCHRDIPYETVNRIRAGEGGHICGNCGRIIVALDDESGA